MNINVFFKSKITAEEFIILSVIQQNSNGETKEYLETLSPNYEELLKRELIKFVKRKNKSQTEHDLVRIDKKGNKLLVDLFTYSPDEDTEKIIDWVAMTYKSMGKFMKNKKETCRRCAFFSEASNIKKNALVVLIRSFLQNVYIEEIHGDNFYEAKKENPNLVLSMKLDDLFWKPKDIYSRHYNLDDSPLYNFYLEHKEQLDEMLTKYEEN